MRLATPVDFYFLRSSSFLVWIVFQRDPKGTRAMATTTHLYTDAVGDYICESQRPSGANAYIS